MVKRTYNLSIRPPKPITPREMQLRDLLYTDISQRDIAKNLGLTYTGLRNGLTVKLYTRLGIKNRVHLMSLEIQRLKELLDKEHFGKL